MLFNERVPPVFDLYYDQADDQKACPAIYLFKRLGHYWFNYFFHY